MPRYKVRHAYASNHNGRRFGPWEPGDVVELDEADAEWVERDSPGTLTDPGVKAKPAETGDGPQAPDGTVSTPQGGTSPTVAPDDEGQGDEPAQRAPAKSSRKRPGKASGKPGRA